MKTLALVGLALASAAVPAAAQKVTTGTAEWDALPAAKIGFDDIDYNRLVRWTTQELQKPECRAKGMRPTRFDVDEPYAVLVAPNGTVWHIVVREMGCPGLNTVIGSTLADMARRGKFHATGETAPAWYGGRLTYAAADSTPH
jgi:hypothetical protein